MQEESNEEIQVLVILQRMPRMSVDWPRLRDRLAEVVAKRRLPPRERWRWEEAIGDLPPRRRQRPSWRPM